MQLPSVLAVHAAIPQLRRLPVRRGRRPIDRIWRPVTAMSQFCPSHSLGLKGLILRFPLRGLDFALVGPSFCRVGSLS